MKKLMILGASILQLPAIRTAKEMGLYVIAVDMDENAIGFKEADECLVISTIDIPSVLEAAKRLKINGIMTLASDMPIRTVSAIADELGIIGISKETAHKATNKILMRECLRNNKIPIPLFYRVNDFDNYMNVIKHFRKSCIVKPADNSGSRGVYLIKNINDIDDVNFAYKYSKEFSHCGEIVVEEFMKGPEVSVETLSINGQVHIIAITDKLTTGAPRFVEMGHSQPSRLSCDIKRQINIITKAAVQALGILIGPSHTEIIITKDGPKIVEIGARLGGDNITTHLVPLSTGIDMVKCCIELALGDKPNIYEKTDKASAIRYFETGSGKLVDINGIKEANEVVGVKQISFVKKIGDILNNINSSADRIGFVVSQADNVGNAISTCEKAISKVKISIN